jgi:hypothetical protein
MKWTEYPNEADRRANRNGVQREGQELASAPGGWKWAIMPGHGPGRIALLHKSGDRVWSLADVNQ